MDTAANLVQSVEKLSAELWSAAGAVHFALIAKHIGFQVYKRTDLDEQGNPYPLLYMSLNI